MIRNGSRLRVRPGKDGRKELQTQASFGSNFYGGPRTAPGAFGNYGAGSGYSRSGNWGVSSMMDGIIPNDESVLNQLYRDMYYHDSVAGAAVDMMSTLPFSDFSMSGATDEQLDTFRSNIDRLNIVHLLPELSTDYLVLGNFVATLIYKKQERLFTDLIPHNPDDCIFRQTPFYGTDPVIQLRVSEEIKYMVTSNDPYMKSIRERLNPGMIRALQNDVVTLESLNTLYVPRKTFSNSLGTSLFRRLLPMYFLESLLYKGTYTEAMRRQRSILHVTAGDDDWEPTEDELNDLVSMFQEANLDPTNAIVATRDNVDTNDLRPGGDFWKITDIQSDATKQKLRAMGISENFLSGEATYRTMETALSVFIEHMRAYREMVTRRVLTGKVLPLVSITNGFYHDLETEEGKAMFEKAAKPPKAPELTAEEIEYNIGDTSQLVVPQVNWHKQLRPEADEDYLDILDTLSDQGVPIPLRMWAAAGGVDMDTVMSDLEEDQKLRQEINKYSEEEDDGGGGMFSSAVTRLPWHKREYGEAAEAYDFDKNGKKHYAPNQKQKHRKWNKMIAKARKKLSDPNELDRNLKSAREAGYTGPYGKV